MTIAFTPFSTSLLGQYGNQQISVIVYGSNIIITGFYFNNLEWWYATKNRSLVDSDLDPTLMLRYVVGKDAEELIENGKKLSEEELFQTISQIL